MPTDPIPAGTVRHPGGCLQPVLLRGRVDHIDGATGELLHRYTTVHEPGGVLPIACKTRRASRCPPCAEVYRADTYQLIRAGLTGGKGIPATVADHPCVFATLTAPSFGPVHARRETRRPSRWLPPAPAAPEPARTASACPAPQKHARDDDRLGEPLCPDCYDYTGSVLFNACAPELWRRFTITLRRTLARQAGLTGKALRRPGAALLRQGRRIPAPRGRPLPRHHPPRRPRRTDHCPARLGHPRPAHRRHRPGRPHRPRRDPHRSRTDRPDPGVGPRTRHPPGHHHGGANRCQGRRVRRQVRHQGRRMHRHPRPPHHPGRPARRRCPSATTPAVTSPNASGWASSPASKTCAWPPGHTCSASAATSRPRAAPTPPPSARSAPTAPPTSASRHRRRAPARPRRRHHAHRHRLALRRTRRHHRRPCSALTGGAP